MDCNNYTTALTVYQNTEEPSKLKCIIKLINSKIKYLFIANYKSLFLYFTISVFFLFAAASFVVYDRNMIFFIGRFIVKYKLELIYIIILSLSFLCSFSALSRIVNIILCGVNSTVLGIMLYLSFLDINSNSPIILLTSSIWLLLSTVFSSYSEIFSKKCNEPLTLKSITIYLISCFFQIYLLYLLFSLIINLFMLG